MAMSILEQWGKSILVLFGIAIGAWAQPSVPLKGYSYPSDGFAMKFPYAPQPHRDRVHPDFNVYTVRLGQHAALSVRMIADAQTCDAALGKLKSMAASQNVAIREFSVSGRPAWEEKEHSRSGGGMVFERYVCGAGRFYVLTLAWPETERRPSVGVDIMDSFRLLK